MPLAANETKGKPRLIAARPNHTKRSQSIYIFVGIAAVASCRLKKQVCDSCPACRTSVVSHIMEGPETRASAGLSRGGDGAKPSKDETSPRSAKNRFHSFRLQMAGSHAFANIPRQSNTSGAGGKRRDPFSQNRGSVNRKKKQSLIDTTKDVPQASSMAERRPVFGDMARSIQKQVAGVRAFANKHRVDERERPKQSETISQRSAKDRFHSVQLQVAGTHAFANIPRHGDGKKKLAEDQGDVDHGVGRQTTALERSPWDGIGSVAREESDQVQDIEFTRRQQRTADDRLRSAKQKLAAVTAFSRKSNDKDADLEDQTSSEFSSRQQRTVGDRLRSAKQKLAAVTAFSRKSNDKEADLEDQASSEFSSRQQRTVGDRLRSADTELDRTSPQFTRRQQCARRAYSSMFSCISSCCTCARRVYSSMFDLNGRFFIFKMYFMEMLATMLQLYNMKHIYLCTMGLGDVYIALSILVFELVSIVHTTFHLTPETRDRQLVIDVFTDVFFLGYPVFMIGEVYTIPIDAQQTMLLTIFPTFSILSKMNDVWEALYVVTAEAAIAGKHTIPAENRRIVSQSVTKVPQISKKSIFKEIMIGSGKLPAVCKPPPPPPRRSIMSFQISNETFDEQLRCFPRCARCMCIFVNGLFCVFFLVIAGLQLSALNVAENGLHMSQIECIEQHTGEIWYSCKLQVPFCVETIYPRCDCAIVRMLNYSRTVLPPNFTQMRSVLKLQIYKGELEAIASLKGLSSLLTLEVIGTKLKSLHAETATHIPNLLQLVLIENRLTALPDLSNMTQLTRLHVYSNELTLLPPLPKNIVILFAYNNKLTSLPVTFSGLRQLRQCRLFNNRLAAFPEGIGGLENLEELLAWNNTIEKLPESISHLKKLKAADVRNNKLSVLPEKINEIRLMYFSLNGNPICSLGILSGEKCKKPCSPDCSPSLLHNEKCDDLIRVYKTTTLFDPQDEGARLVKRARSGSGCFTEACKKDDGACSIERGDPLPFRSD